MTNKTPDSFRERVAEILKKYSNVRTISRFSKDEIIETNNESVALDAICELHELDKRNFYSESKIIKDKEGEWLVLGLIKKLKRKD